MAAEEHLIIQASVNDNLTPAMKRMERSVAGFEQSTNRKLSGVSGGFAAVSSRALTAAKSMAALGAALAVTGGIAAGIRGAHQYADAIAEVSTLVDTAAVDVGHLKDQVLELAAAQNQSELTVARGLYQALSAGVSDANDALELTAQASKLAVAGVAEVSDTVDLLTTVLNAYSLQAGEAANVSDVLFSTVQLGKTTVPELSAALGRVLPIANQVGVSFEEVAAAVATLTLNGLSTAEAVTQVRAVLNALLRNADAVDEAMQAVGGSFSTADIRAHGLVEALQTIQTASGGTAEGMLALLGEVEAVGGASGLLANDAERLRETLDSLRDSAGSTEQAFEKQMAAPSKVVSQALNQARVAAVKFGDRLLESAARVIKMVQGSEELVTLGKRLGVILGSVAEGALRLLELHAEAVILALDKLALVFNRVTDAAIAAFAAIHSVFNDTDSSPLLRELDRVENKLDEIDWARVFSPPTDSLDEFERGVRRLGGLLEGSVRDIRQLQEAIGVSVPIGFDQVTITDQARAQAQVALSDAVDREFGSQLLELDVRITTERDDDLRKQLLRERERLAARAQREVSESLEVPLRLLAEIDAEIVANIQKGEFDKIAALDERVRGLAEQFPQLAGTDILPTDAIGRANDLLRQTNGVIVDIGDGMVAVTGIARQTADGFAEGAVAISDQLKKTKELVVIGKQVNDDADLRARKIEVEASHRAGMTESAKKLAEIAERRLRLEEEYTSIVSAGNFAQVAGLRAQQVELERNLDLTLRKAEIEVQAGERSQEELERLREARQVALQNFEQYKRQQLEASQLDLARQVIEIEFSGRDDLEAQIVRTELRFQRIIESAIEKLQEQSEFVPTDLIDRIVQLRDLELQRLRIADQEAQAEEQRRRQREVASIYLEQERELADGLADRLALVGAETERRIQGYREAAAEVGFELEELKRIEEQERRIGQARQQRIREEVSRRDSNDIARLRARFSGTLEANARLIRSNTEASIRSLEAQARAGERGAEALAELVSLQRQIGEQEVDSILSDAALREALLVADAVALVNDRLVDRLAAIEAADRLERDRARDEAKQYVDEARALEALTLRIDAQTAALVQQEVVRERERSGEEIQRWGRVREAIEEVNAAVRAGTIDLSDRQMVLIETIRQMEVEANTIRTGLQAGVFDFTQYAGNLAARGEEAGRDITFSMSRNLGDALVDIGRDFDSAGDAAEEFGRRTVEAIGEIAAQMAALQIVNGALGAFGIGLSPAAGFAGIGTSAGGAAAAGAAAGAPTFALGPGTGFAFADGGVIAGGLGKLKPLHAYADGGPIVREPHVALIGEGRYNEAVVPLPNGRELPVDLRMSDLPSARETRSAQPEQAPVINAAPVTVNVTVNAQPDRDGRVTLDPKTVRDIQDAVTQGVNGGNQSLRNAIRGLRR